MAKADFQIKILGRLAAKRDSASDSRKKQKSRTFVRLFFFSISRKPQAPRSGAWGLHRTFTYLLPLADSGKVLLHATISMADDCLKIC
jgi:hypothetical protein